MTMSSAMAGNEETWPRQLQPHWNARMIVASIAISLLGAFTSTQLMCQARMSLRFTSILAWTVLGSLTFGFCSVWCLHFVAMLACELDASIGIDVPLTLLSSILAVIFTFSALASDLLLARYAQQWWKGHGSSRKRRIARKGARDRSSSLSPQNMSKPFLEFPEEENYPLHSPNEEVANRSRSCGTLALKLNGNALGGIHTPPESPSKSPPPADDNVDTQESQPLLHHTFLSSSSEASSANQGPENPLRPSPTKRLSEERRSTELTRDASSEYSSSRRSSSFLGSTSNGHALSDLMVKAYRSTSPAKNTFIATGGALYEGCTARNIIKSFIWSLAITSMHYVGIAALRIPDGYFTLDLGFVILSALISWLVCLVGCILMLRIETNLAQQCLFSVVASTGVAAMHFTGMPFHCSLWTCS